MATWVQIPTGGLVNIEDAREIRIQRTDGGFLIAADVQGSWRPLSIEMPEAAARAIMGRLADKLGAFTRTAELHEEVLGTSTPPEPLPTAGGPSPRQND